MKTSTQVIVLGYVKYGDSSIVLHTLGPVYGKRSFLVKIGKKTSMGLFLPLNILECTVVESRKSTLYSAHSFSALSSLGGIRASIHKNTMTLFLSEVLYRVIKEGDVDPALFEWCEKSIMTLDSLPGDYANFHIRFLLEMCLQLGFRPSTEDLAPYIHGHIDAVKDLLEKSFAESMLVPLGGEDRNEICEQILHYLEHHTDSRIRVNSLSVLREIYS